jgi:hypothetical protein
LGLNDPDYVEGLPVVCYLGDNIFVSWVFYTPPVGTEEDVLQILLANDGSFNTGYYSQVNMDYVGMQSIPSISAFYSSGYVFYSFMDFEDAHIKSKTSYHTNQQLKKSQFTKIIISPNPANGSFSVFAKENGFLKIFDMKGNELLSKEIFNGNNSINIDGIIPGIYQILTVSENFTENQKLFIY